MSGERPVRAPAGAVAWEPARGWLYPGDEPSSAEALDAASPVFIVSSRDGAVHGVSRNEPAPLVAVLRLETDVAQLVERVNELFAEPTEGEDMA